MRNVINVPSYLYRIKHFLIQLGELLKYTPVGHPDHEPVKSALVAMKEVAQMINDRKRKLENITKISKWQNAVLNWQVL